MNFSQIARPLCLTGLLLASSAAFAGPSPQGEWRVADGTATIRIHRCGGVWCGKVVTTITPAGKDIHNPDPHKRSRTVLGLEVLYGLRATAANAWTGYSYNAQDGQTYTITVSLASESALRVQGCVPGGGACGGETWTRTH
ncbi:MAG: DUF2147 domain-containing protein [Methylovirgula sp.]|nr:DUF2147 domain-containing protein [Methylovirgula sp.]